MMGVLLMLLSIGGLVTALVVAAIALIAKKTWLLKFTLAAVVVWFSFYALMLLGLSLTSTEKMLAAGEAKEYCGFYFDCHMHTVVTSIRTVKAIGDIRARGIFYIVGIKVFSDARDPRIRLHLIEPKARVVIPNGNEIYPDKAAEMLLPSASVRLDGNITNQQSIQKEIVFDLPQTAANPKLLITEGYGIDRSIEHVLVGDEDSLFHAQTFFELPEQTDTAGVN
jgi:hypothetical protein